MGTLCSAVWIAAGCTGGSASTPDAVVAEPPRDAQAPDAQAPDAQAPDAAVHAPFIADQARPLGLALDASYVYWLNGGIVDALQNPVNGGLFRASLAGGPPESLVLDLVAPRDLVVDASHVYYIASDAIWKLAKDGSSEPTQLAANVTGGFLEQNETSLFYGQDALLSLGKDGGQPVELVPDLSIVWSVAASSDSVFFSSSQVPGIRRVPALGGGVEELGGGMEALNILLDGSTVFFSEAPDGQNVRTRKLDLGTGAFLNLAIETGCNVLGVVGDATNAYMAYETECGGPNRIVLVPKEPGSSSLLVDGLEGIGSLAIDETHLYWVSPGRMDTATGSIHRVTK